MKRKCTACGELKELTIENFYKAFRNQFGFHVQCKKCMIKKQIENNKKKNEYKKMFIG